MSRAAAGNRDKASGRAREREASDAVLPSKRGNRGLEARTARKCMPRLRRGQPLHTGQLLPNGN